MLHGEKVVLGENIAVNGSAKIWQGGKGKFYAEATWSAGTVKLQAKSPNGTWIDVTDNSLTANGITEFNLPQGEIRVNIATSTAVYAYAVAVPH
jgi:hypothetical protein